MPNIDLKDQVHQLNTRIEELESINSDKTLELENKSLRKERDELIVQVNMNKFNPTGPFENAPNGSISISGDAVASDLEALRAEYEQKMLKVEADRAVAEENTIKVS